MAESSAFFSTDRRPHSPAARGDNEASPQTGTLCDKPSDTGSSIVRSSSSQRPLAKRRCNRDKATTATCGICLETIDEQGLLLRHLSSGKLAQSCVHPFCFTCVVTWAERTNTCPMCKERFNAVRRKISSSRFSGAWETVEVTHKDPDAEVASDEDLAAAFEHGSDSDDSGDQEGPQAEAGSRMIIRGRHGYIIDDFIAPESSGEEEEEEEEGGEEEEEWETWEDDEGAEKQTRSPDVVHRRASDRQRTRALARGGGVAEMEGQELRYSRRRGFVMSRRSQRNDVAGGRGTRMASAGGRGGGTECGRGGGGRYDVVDSDDVEDDLEDEARELQRDAARVLGNSPLQPRRRPPPTSRLPVPEYPGRSSTNIRFSRSSNTYNDERVRLTRAAGGSSAASASSGSSGSRGSVRSLTSNRRRRSPPLATLTNGRIDSSSSDSRCSYSWRTKERGGVVSSSMEDDDSEVDGAGSGSEKVDIDVENGTQRRERLVAGARGRAGGRESSLRSARGAGSGPGSGPAATSAATLRSTTRLRRIGAGLESGSVAVASSSHTRVAAGLRSGLSLPGHSVLARHPTAAPQWGPWMSRQVIGSSRGRGRTCNGSSLFSAESSSSSSRVGGVPGRGKNGAVNGGGRRGSSSFVGGHASTAASGGGGTGDRIRRGIADSADVEEKGGGRRSEYNCCVAVGSDDEETPRRQKRGRSPGSGAQICRGDNGVGVEGKVDEDEVDDDEEEVEFEWRVGTLPSSEKQEEATMGVEKDDSERSHSRLQQQQQRRQSEGRDAKRLRGRSHQGSNTEQLGLRERLLRHSDNGSFRGRPAVGNSAGSTIARKKNSFDSEDEDEDDDAKRSGKRGLDGIGERGRGCSREDAGARMGDSPGVGYLERFRYTGYLA